MRTRGAERAVEPTGVICGACGDPVQLADARCAHCGHVFGQAVPGQVLDQVVHLPETAVVPRARRARPERAPAAAAPPAPAAPAPAPAAPAAPAPRAAASAPRPPRAVLLGAAGGAAAVLLAGAAVMALTGGASTDGSGDGAEPAREPVSWTGAATAQAPTTSPDGRDAAGRPTSYAADQMLDADPATAWRTDGDATGAVLTFALDTTRPVSRLGLVNGYAKTDPATGADRYAQGRRITRVTWLLDGREVPQELLDGVREPQVVDVGPVVVGQVQLRIDATTGPGDAAFDRTAVSDVTIAG